MKTNQEIVAENLLKLNYCKKQKDYYNREVEKYRSLRNIANKNIKIFERELEKNIEKGIIMGDILVKDCDQCLNPFYEDQLTEGLCPNCSENDLSSFFE